MKEWQRFKKIEGYPGYFITDTGDVYCNRKSNCGWQGVRKLSHKGRNNPHRYLSVCLSVDGKKKYLQIHRLVALAYCSGYFPGAVVNHKDGNIHNNHYSNLEWVSQKENIHKSYITSGVNQTRNFQYFELIDPAGNIMGVFKGRNQAKDFIDLFKLDTSFSSLVKHGKSRGYVLKRKESNNITEAVTTIP